MSFKSLFIAVFLGVSLIVAALIINAKRPSQETRHEKVQLVRASGKCVECHRHVASAVVRQYEQSRHAAEGINCLECHMPVEGQEEVDHNGFTIAADLTAKNCARCHPNQYRQHEQSRHGAPAWAAVHGRDAFTEEQLALAEKFHPGAVDRDPNVLAKLEGSGAMEKGCNMCHAIGRSNADGSIGNCTECHARHYASIELARRPETCGQCHMGPDHSQIEIFNESKHGILFQAQLVDMNLRADPKTLSTDDMPVPACATCHMSGLGTMDFTHDVSSRLSWWLFAPISEKRPGYIQNQSSMKGVCFNCHGSTEVNKFYDEAELVVQSTNEKVAEAKAVMDGLREEGLLTPEPFDEPIEFLYFDYWHYYGRTAKHGAFMGGADFVQWHGNYELLLKMHEIKKEAEELRSRKSAH